MPNPDGTYTREEHRAAIFGLYLKNIEAGMDEDTALNEAGKTWRESLKQLADAKIAFVKSSLGIPDTEEEANERADNGRNTGGKSYHPPR